MDFSTILAMVGFAVLAASSLSFWGLFHLVVQARLAEASIKVDDTLKDVFLRMPRRRLDAYAAQLSDEERQSVLNRFILVWSSTAQWTGLALMAIGLLLQAAR